MPHTPIRFCGTNHYSSTQLEETRCLITYLHHLAMETQRRLAPDRPLNTYIYSASTCGILTALVFAQYNGFSIKGFFDQKGAYLRQVSHELGVFWDRPRNVFNISQDQPDDVELIVCATAPSHYREIEALVQKFYPQIPMIFVHRAEQYPCSPSLPPQGSHPILVATTGRCGTHWFKAILNFLLGPYFTEINASQTIKGHQIIDQQVFRKLKERTFTIDHFELSEDLINYARRNHIRLIYLYRDPRDIQVSNSFYKNKTYSFDLDGIVAKANEILKWLSVPNIYKVRYEDLNLNPLKTLKKLVSYLHLPTDSKTIERVVEATSFEYFTNGRRPGEEDPVHHYRKGVIGDWKNFYTEQNKNMIKKECGRELIAIGYEKDFNW